MPPDVLAAERSREDAMDMQDATRILIVDDSKFFTSIVKKAISERIDAEIVTAETLAAARRIVESTPNGFHLALADILLPDSKEGEAAEFLMQKRIPTIVFTSFYSEDLRKMILDWNVMDYVIKDTPSSLSYLVDIVERVHRNRETRILVADESESSRMHVRGLLMGYQCQVIEAANAKEALELLRKNDIRLVIADYELPDMNGAQLVQEIRKKYNREQLAIVGISAEGNRSALSAQFIKLGADDFLKKPFLPEEFFCRITHNLRMLDLFSKLKDMGIKDTLTGIHNRRFFFEAGAGLFATAKREQLRLTAAVLDLDFFKDLNEKYGHGASDVVLKGVATLLRKQCRQTDIVARSGLDGFAILAVNLTEDTVGMYFERIRHAIEKQEFNHMDRIIKITASIGVCFGTRDTLEEMMKEADQRLADAKRIGRNRIEMRPIEGN